MQFPQPLLPGRLIRRYKRFLADVELEDGRQVTAHTPNTGSMKGCCDPGSPVWLKESGISSRKYPLSWELVETLEGTLVGINTGLSNSLVEEGIRNGTVAELANYETIRREVRYGLENSRIDLLLESAGPRCYAEVKNVTLAENQIAFFPDAVSARGSKHLRELAEIVRQGNRGVILFCVQRADVRVVRPADHIDMEYGKLLREAVAVGVEALAYRASVSIEGICLEKPLPVICP
jgi:sugar fermentation stimulation protein A